MTSKLILGSANFGLQYGIANKRKLDKDEVFEILDKASVQGIWGIDTARGYGNAENVIGEYFARHGKTLNIITKLSQKEYNSEKEVEDEVILSMENLTVPYIDIVLVHSFDAFRKSGAVILSALKSLINSNKIGQFGISVYHPNEAEAFLSKVNESVAVEFPINLFDQRFLEGDLLKRIKENGHSLLARSIFLQGVFFMEPARLEGIFVRIADKVIKMRELADNLSIGIGCLAALFVIGNQWIDGVIMGVDSLKHFISNIDCLRENNKELFRRIEPLVAELRVDDEEIILPYRWKS